MHWVTSPMETPLLWSASATGQLNAGSVGLHSGVPRNRLMHLVTSPMLTLPLPLQSPLQVLTMTWPAAPLTLTGEPPGSDALATLLISRVPGGAAALMFNTQL